MDKLDILLPILTTAVSVGATLVAALLGGLLTFIATMLGVKFSFDHSNTIEIERRKKHDIENVNLLFELLSQKRIFSNRGDFTKHKNHNYAISSVLEVRGLLIDAYKQYQTDHPSKRMVYNMIIYCNQFLTNDKNNNAKTSRSRHRNFVGFLDKLSGNIECEFNRINSIDGHDFNKLTNSSTGFLKIRGCNCK